MESPEQRASRLIEELDLDKNEDIRLIGEFKSIYRQCAEIAANCELIHKDSGFSKHRLVMRGDISEAIKKAGDIQE